MPDYTAQQKHLRTHYKRLSVDFRPELLDEFKRICSQHGTTPTAEIKRMIKEFCEIYREQSRE